MKFDAEKGDRGAIYDADGRLIPYPISGDTETGEVVCQVRDSNGKIIEVGYEIVTAQRCYKAPLEIRDLPFDRLDDLQKWADEQPAARPLP